VASPPRGVAHGGGSPAPSSPAAIEEEPLLGPPSVSRTGRLYHQDRSPSLEPHFGLARQLPMLKTVSLQRVAADACPKAVWSDSSGALLGEEEPWPNHAVPLWIFSSDQGPSPGYREEFRFTLYDEKYVNFALTLRCGTGDKYMGGSVGIVRSSDGAEATPGSVGQLMTITDLLVQPDTSVLVSAIGDLPFRVLRTWMPRGLRGIQFAYIDVAPFVPRLDTIAGTCAGDALLEVFARLCEGASPGLWETLADRGPFTAFVPTGPALAAALGLASGEVSPPLEELRARSADYEAVLRCHICPGMVANEALYSGRQFRALDGTMLCVNFTQWPNKGPHVNGIPIQQLDVKCSNGVIHTIAGVLRPAPEPGRRGQR